MKSQKDMKKLEIKKNKCKLELIYKAIDNCQSEMDKSIKQSTNDTRKDHVNHQEV